MFSAASVTVSTRVRGTPGAISTEAVHGVFCVVVPRFWKKTRPLGPTTAGAPPTGAAAHEMLVGGDSLGMTHVAYMAEMSKVGMPLRGHETPDTVLTQPTVTNVAASEIDAAPSCMRYES